MILGTTKPLIEQECEFGNNLKFFDAFGIAGARLSGRPDEATVNVKPEVGKGVTL